MEKITPGENKELFILSCLNISPGKFAPASYNVTPTFLESIQKEPQAAVCFDNGQAIGEMGGLVLICGPASDKESMADASLFAASKDLLVATALCYRVMGHLQKQGIQGLQLAKDFNEAFHKAEGVLKQLGLVDAKL